MTVTFRTMLTLILRPQFQRLSAVWGGTSIREFRKDPHCRGYIWFFTWWLSKDFSILFRTISANGEINIAMNRTDWRIYSTNDSDCLKRVQSIFSTTWAEPVHSLSVRGCSTKLNAADLSPSSRSDQLDRERPPMSSWRSQQPCSWCFCAS